MQLNQSKALTALAAVGMSLAWGAGGWAQTTAGTQAPVDTAASSVPQAAAAEAAPAALPEGVTPEMMTDGEKLFFQNCRRCHGMRGKAGVPLSGNQNIADAAYIASIIITGRGYMPPLGEHLNDEQIALIGTFARNSWGNAYGPVTPQDVKDMR